jgi:hypothetical protein
MGRGFHKLLEKLRSLERRLGSSIERKLSYRKLQKTEGRLRRRQICRT